MPYRDLSTPEMVSLSSPWTNPEHPDRVALMVHPIVASYTTHVDNVHGDIVTYQRDTAAERLSEIRARQRTLDRRADSLSRGIHATLQANIHINANPDKVDPLRVLEQILFPQGLAVINLSYREFAGYGELLKGRLSESVRAQLAAIPAADGSLLDRVDEWLAVAREIGQLEHERGEFANRRTTAVRLRSRWIRMVQTLRILVETLDAGNDTIDTLFARIDQTIRRAEQRRLRGGEPSEEEPELEPIGEDDGSSLPEPDPGDIDIEPDPEGPVSESPPDVDQPSAPAEPASPALAS